MQNLLSRERLVQTREGWIPATEYQPEAAIGPGYRERRPRDVSLCVLHAKCGGNAEIDGLCRKCDRKYRACCSVCGRKLTDRAMGLGAGVCLRCWRGMSLTTRGGYISRGNSR